ncbi:DUF6531 domain-containing protein [Xanthomonas arboricola]|uniref:DUF6531 domain-containing protein n=1 Tax=Xanthomonas arboricola TaxID=56448 RepID=UPI000CEEF7D6|nr:DUF6531 domain-containing protein [Xanthomonas arboricola]PPT30540.1 hypothetical protein XarbCFBP7614_03090 [Xanthomonas arboricola]
MDDSSVVRQEAVDKAAPRVEVKRRLGALVLGVQSLGALALLAPAQDANSFGRYICSGGFTNIAGGPRLFSPVCWFQEDYAGEATRTTTNGRARVRANDGGGSGGFATSPGAKEQPTNDKRDSADCSGEKSGNPVVISTGNKVEPELDFAANGEMGLYLERTYNAFWTARGLFGTYWLSNFDYTLVPAGNTIWAQRPDGRRIKFLLDAGSGHYLEEKASPVAFVVKQADGSFVLYNETRGTEKYDKRGYITERRNEQGVAWSFRYDGAYLQEVTHTSGRSIKFAWADGVVTQATDPAGNVYRYGYQQNVFGLGLSKGRLASATLPGAPETVISYHYEDARFVGALTGKSFNGQRYSTFAYDDQGRATSTEHAGGVERFSFSYSVPATQAITPPPAPLPPGGFTGGETGGSCSTPRPGSGEICVRPSSVGGGAVRLSAQSMSTNAGSPMATAAATGSTIPKKMLVTETSPLGRQTTYTYEDGRQTEVTGAASPHCPASYKAKTYDANGYEDIASDFADNLTDFDYDAQGHLLKKVEAKGTSAERTLTYAWDQANRMVRETIAGDHETRVEYDADGRVSKHTLVDLTGYGQGRTKATTYSYTKHSNGLLATMKVDGPLPGSQDSVIQSFSSVGDLTSVANGIGQATTYSAHNALGQPGRVTGPNGDVMEYRYDGRGREVERRTSINGAWVATTTAYDGAGNIATVRTGDGVSQTYLYDAARRVKEVYKPKSDGMYERKRFEYNNASLVTKTEVLDTAYTGSTYVTGNIDGLWHDAAWNWYVAGWACSTGYAGSIDVHPYVGGSAGYGTALPGATANIASEPAVAQQCQTSGSAYRFNIALPGDVRNAHGGKPLYVHGISPAGLEHSLLNGSGKHFIPEVPKVIGNIDQIYHDGAYNWYVDGWACSTGTAASIDVHMYVGGSAGAGSFLLAATANQGSDASLSEQCQAAGSAYRFHIPLPADVRKNHGGKSIFIHGISPVGREHSTIAGSGAFAIPATGMRGDIQAVEYDSNWNYSVKGWACGLGVSDHVAVLLYAGGGPGAGTHFATVWANQAEDAGAAAQCDTATQGRTFRFPLDFNLRNSLGDRRIYAVALTPGGALSDYMLPNSGTHALPRMDRSSTFVGWNNVGPYAPGETRTISATFQNTGNVVWGAAGVGNIYMARGSATNSLNQTHGLPRPVYPGDRVSFSWSYTAPRPVTTTRYHVVSQMLADGAPFGALASGIISVDGAGGCTGIRCTQPMSVGDKIKIQGDAK